MYAILHVPPLSHGLKMQIAPATYCSSKRTQPYCSAGDFVLVKDVDFLLLLAKDAQHIAPPISLHDTYHTTHYALLRTANSPGPTRQEVSQHDNMILKPIIHHLLSLLLLSACLD